MRLLYLRAWRFLFACTARWQFIPGTRPLAAAAPHELVKSLEVSTGFAAGEELRRLQRGEFFCHCRGYELVDARPIFPALLLHCLFLRTRQAQRISLRLAHCRILSSAS